MEKTFKSFKTKGEDLAKFFVDYHRTKQIASGDIDEEMEEEGPPEEENTVQEDDAKKKPELHQQLVIDVRLDNIVSYSEYRLFDIAKKRCRGEWGMSAPPCLSH